MLGRAADELGSVQDPLHEVPAGLARGYCILSSVAPALVKPSFAGSSNIPPAISKLDGELWTLCAQAEPAFWDRAIGTQLRFCLGRTLVLWTMQLWSIEAVVD